jgi:hypothetical protein
MALHTTANADFRTSPVRRHRGRHDVALFWLVAISACLIFWAAVAYGIHSVVS